MKKRDFYFFVVPSLLMMFLFIAVPLAIVFKQSFYITQNVFQEIGGKDAYYFKKNNIQSLIQQMEKTWSNSTERNNRIQKNFEYVQNFNEKRQSNEIMNIYNTLLQ